MNLNELPKRMNSTIMENSLFKMRNDLQLIRLKLIGLRIKLLLLIRDHIQTVLRLGAFINKIFLKMRSVWFKNEFNSIIPDCEKRQLHCQIVKTTGRFPRRERLEKQKLSLVSHLHFYLRLIINKKQSEHQSHSTMKSTEKVRLL